MPISTDTFNGVPAGMNLANPSHELQDNEARYLQDILLDKPGLIRRRGPVRPASTFPALPKPGSGLFGTLNPQGQFRMMALDGDGSSSNLRLFDNTFGSYSTFPWNGAMPSTPPSAPYRIVDAKPALTGGIMLGTSSQYSGTGLVQNLALWRGGNNADYSTGTITLTRGSSIVTGSGTSWAANASPGMFLFATHNDGTAGTGRAALTYIGVVKTVDSNTQLTLGATTLYPQASASLGTLSYVLTSVRGIVTRENKGRATCTTAATTITGANTKFSSGQIETVVLSSSGTTNNVNGQITGLSSTTSLKVGMRISGTGVGTNAYISSIDSATQVTASVNGTANGTATITFKHNWNFYRASDLAWIGRLATVNNDISITLTANAAVALNNERFIAFNSTGDWSVSNQKTNGLGFLSSTYAQRQWYANNGLDSSNVSRVWFSDPADPEGVDLAPYDGDFIDIASSIGTDTPIKALVPAYNALVVIKENETFAIYGTTPTTFSVKKIEDDGTLAGMSAAAYGGGVIWAGRDGIHYYDGITVTNLSANKLGDYYKNSLRGLDPTSYRMWGAIVRDHYFLHIENFSPNVSVVKGTTTATPSSITIVINMATQAFTVFTNCALRSAVETPADTGKNILLLMNTTSAGYIVNAYDLFDTTGADTLLCDAGRSASQYDYGYKSVVDTTLGTATATAIAADTKYVSKLTVNTPCAVYSINAYIGGIGGGSSTSNIQGVIYSDVVGVPTTLIASSTATTIAKDAQPGFVTFTFATPVELAAGDYWFGFINETASIANYYSWATVSGARYNSDVYAGGADNPFGSASSTTGPLTMYVRVRTTGPDFYFESKKMSEDDAMRKKLFKQLAMNYLAQGDSLRLDTVTGMNNIGRTSTTTFPASVYTWDSLAAAISTWASVSDTYASWEALIGSVFRPKRIKFLKRSQMLSFRIWQNSTLVTDAQIGPFQIGFKLQRPGRI